MITYILQVSTAWCALILVYVFVLRKEKFFNLNRWYLLASILGGLLIPLVSWMPKHVVGDVVEVIPEISSGYFLQLEYVSTLTEHNLISSSEAVGKTWAWSDFLIGIYVLGVIVMLVKGAVSAMKLATLIGKSAQVKYTAYTELQVQANQLPFSFFNFICVGNLAQDSDLKNKILQHELYHVRSLHSLDVLLVEILKIAFWWNPLIYIFKHLISENHEYAADAHVLENNSRKTYCELLMQSTFPNINLQLSNHFNQSFITKRINMMYQEKSKKVNVLKYVLSSFAFVFLFLLFVGPLHSQESKWKNITSVFTIESNSEINPEAIKVSVDGNSLKEGEDYLVNGAKGTIYIIENEKVDKNTPVKVEFNDVPTQNSSQEQNPTTTIDCIPLEGGVYYRPDNMVRANVCEHIEDTDEAYDCTISRLSAFARTNAKFPEEALKEGFQGTVFLYLTIGENGDVVNAEVPQNMKRDYGYGIEEEALRLGKEIEKEFQFVPASCKGTKVKSKIFVAYSYKIGAEEKPFVKVKDSNTVGKVEQNVTINHISQKGKLSFEYRSNMNVPSTVYIINPEGTEIFRESYPYKYKTIREGVTLDNPMNGKYEITVVQDGEEVHSFINANVFK